MRHRGPGADRVGARLAVGPEATVAGVEAEQPAHRIAQEVLQSLAAPRHRARAVSPARVGEELEARGRDSEVGHHLDEALRLLVEHGRVRRTVVGLQGGQAVSEERHRAGVQDLAGLGQAQGPREVGLGRVDPRVVRDGVGARAPAGSGERLAVGLDRGQRVVAGREELDGRLDALVANAQHQGHGAAPAPAVGEDTPRVRLGDLLEDAGQHRHRVVDVTVDHAGRTLGQEGPHRPREEALSTERGEQDEGLVLQARAGGQRVEAQQRAQPDPVVPAVADHQHGVTPARLELRRVAHGPVVAVAVDEVRDHVHAEPGDEGAVLHLPAVRDRVARGPVRLDREQLRGRGGREEVGQVRRRLGGGAQGPAGGGGGAWRGRSAVDGGSVAGWQQVSAPAAAVILEPCYTGASIGVHPGRASRIVGEVALRVPSRREPRPAPRTAIHRRGSRGEARIRWSSDVLGGNEPHLRTHDRIAVALRAVVVLVLVLSPRHPRRPSPPPAPPPSAGGLKNSQISLVAATEREPLRPAVVAALDAGSDLGLGAAVRPSIAGRPS